MVSTVEFYRCRICGETYLGTQAPSRCPFCGVTAEYFVPTGDYPEDINFVSLSDVERVDLRKAIDLERSNARFYRGMSLQRDDLKLASAYKRLSVIEAEHCSLFCKLAGIDKPTDLTTPETVSDDWCDNIPESLERELQASTFYAEAAGRASSTRIIEVLLAVSAVERDHIALDGIAAEMAGCD